VEEIADPAKVIGLFGRIAHGRDGMAAWRLLFYALWHRRHILGLPPSGDVFETLAQR
jgi:asparagine synthase (glutamine-hydrolysing)